MSILVTGGNSALAQTLIPHLELSFGSPVYSLVRGKVGGPFEIKCDLTNKTQITDLIEALKPKLIFHLAASISNNFDYDFVVNVQSSGWISECLLKNKMTTRVVVIGSAAEYGVVDNENKPIGEGTVLRPVNIYGLTKKLQTELAIFYAGRGVDVVVARIFNLAIPGLSDRLIYGKAEKFIYSYKHGTSKQLVVGNLAAYRDYIGEDDVSKLLVTLGKKGLAGEVYNIASGKPIMVEDLIRELFKSNNLDCFDDVVVQDKTMDIGVPCVYADTKKILSLT